MDFKKIDIEKWDRKENYTWFTTKNRCKINMTMNVDVTKLIEIIKKINLDITLLLHILLQRY